MAYDFKKEQKELYRPGPGASIVNVPAMNFLAVRGRGNPNDEGGEYKVAIALQYPVAYALRMSYKTDYVIDGFFAYVVPPLEGFWWQPGVDGVDDKDALRWVSAIRVPDFIRQKDVDWAVDRVTQKKGKDFSAVEFLTIEEGLCVQAMHVGSFDTEPETVKMMSDYATSAGYVVDFGPQRWHHEIYLSDPSKVAPEKMRTVIRHPVRPAQ
ncbi:MULTISPECIES: GyrI-like domain-containing protein [Corynebacterium]|uniref:GyrI-like small molecule binding domain-containing protein n=1 Tax=Corynebacterium lipophiloflavum (strain ATCC 700352 / DSM 44291 / CCUG 37336 / JCM 10383 / DMMZ 1944) TaxID=525263 RepID=C0XPL9_CORLD|nr:MULTISPECIES: GyrI-like domain-containing protein [Corynebacterium]EEI17837.1 hypothetical protein HMPREF0298_0389 [Corynebacterium lipophiloflavum DSM 44291]MCT1585787.1 GyrI-like domain-containing protein [Corynebacterium sanguinis]MCT2023524.1 GyrI-like domain-containing protein [Corynebacterium sanguinis]